MSDEHVSGDEGTPAPAGMDPVELGQEDDGFLGTPWSRRTFLKAAALGTATAAVFQKGPGFSLSPAAAWANDLSGSPCTAQDVVLNGSGLVLNEPCTCSGTFDAVVAFSMTNNTGTSRYCITLHFPGTGAFGSQDVILRDTLTNGVPSGSSTLPPGTQTMYGTITGFSCNSGGTAVCVGPLDSNGAPTVIRGKCAAGTCATIAWSTSTGDAGCTTPDQKPPGGQCRHQGICIQGFGISAECADGNCATRDLTDCGNNVTGCSVACGSTLHVKITAGGQSGATCNTGPTLSVKRPGETSFTTFTLGSDGCYTDSSPVAGTYTFRITDCHNCFREDTLQVCVTQPTVSLSSDASGTCGASGDVTFTATTGFDSYKFYVDNTSPTSSDTPDQSGTGNTYAYPVNADNTCHTVTVVATKDTNCTATATSHITQCVTSTVATGDCPA